MTSAKRIYPKRVCNCKARNGHEAEFLQAVGRILQHFRACI